MSTNTNTNIEKKEQSHSERFTEMVLTKFRNAAGQQIALTERQKRLISNYFISVDMTLKAAEEKRLKKSEQYRDSLPVVWQNINMEQLAQNVVACSRIGYDPALPNQIFMIPYKNNSSNQYDITFMEGYRGKELKAKKYGLDIPSDIVIEVVYSNDKFVPHKKDKNNPIETYEFEITNPFERGVIVGGFYYHRYEDKQYKNKLVIYNISEIEKRKPDYASPEFWGGQKDKYENGKKVGKETVEGWHHEMVWKTIFRAAYSDITIDGDKIDDAYMDMLNSESEAKRIAENSSPDAIARDNANKRVISIDDANVIPDPVPEIKPEKPTPEEKPEAPATAEPAPKMAF
jgi:recombination protein RecT